tara:strand:+ start:113 stop:982 length:870 start_codon:yes stop_codon:yes gene_type:complete
MPELPEVEVVKRSLRKKIQNLIIKKVKIHDGNLRYRINEEQIKKLIGKKIIKIERRSKFLIFKIGNKEIMLIHLGMTGKLFFIDQKNKKFKTSFYYNLNETKDNKHNRVTFFLNNKKKLIYNDIRKFGFIKFFDFEKYKNNTHFKNLGPEPLEKYFNYKYLKDYIFGRNRTIKDLLMDQKCISGLGNIYVNEILFSSGIKPARKVKKLKNFEIKSIVINTKKILKSAIKLGGSSIKDFSSDDGKKGKFQQHFKVYDQIGKQCSNIDCSYKVERIVISNRSSFFCKNCQK